MKRHAADPAIENRRKVPPPTDTDPAIEALVQDIIAKVADKWTMLILEVLEEHGTLRFTQIGKHVGNISQKMLTQTLREMEREGLVQRTVHPVVPPKVEYRVTPLGMTLIEALLPLCQWGTRNRSRMAEILQAAPPAETAAAAG